MVEELSPPVVKIDAPKLTLPPRLPPPDSEPKATLKPFKSSTTPAALAKMIAEVESSALITPSLRVPALIVVVPVNVLAPDKVTVPAPSLMRLPLPVPMMLVTVMLPAPPRVRSKPAPVMVPALLRVSVPASEFIRVALPSVTRPP